MRYFRILFLLLLLLASMGLSAQTDSVPIAPVTAVPDTKENVAANADSGLCLPDQIRVHPQHQGVPMRLHDWLTLVVTGTCKKEIETELGIIDTTPGVSIKDVQLHLSLNDVVMQKLPMVAQQGADAAQLLLSFRLHRDSEDDGNRKSWTTFLRNGESCCQSALDLKEMDVAIAVDIGNKSVAVFGNGRNIQFRVEDRKVVAWTFWIFLIVFVVGYVFAIRSPSLLRDVPNGSYSLAKSQMAFWGLIVALSFTGIWFVIGSMEQIPDDVLILLGISAVTGWLAPYATESSEASANAKLIAQKQLTEAAIDTAKTSAENPELLSSRLNAINAAIHRIASGDHLRELKGFLGDICSDGNGFSVHRVQAVAWTLILGVIFICEVTMVISMPVFADNLLLLLGISNGTYLTLKTREKP